MVGEVIPIKGRARIDRGGAGIEGGVVIDAGVDATGFEVHGVGLGIKG